MSKSTLMKFFKSHRKLLTGIVILFLVLILIILGVCYSKNSLRGKKRVGKFYFDEIEGVQKVTKDSGVYEKTVDWDSVKYTLDGMIVEVARYQNRNIRDGIGQMEEFQDVTIQGVTYRYKETTLYQDFRFRQYYTQVGDNDTYYVSVTFQYSEENVQKIEKFLNSVVLKNK